MEPMIRRTTCIVSTSKNDW